MIRNLLILLTFISLFFNNPTLSQEIWRESFSIPEKGVWGDENSSTIQQDFSGITTWTLDFSKIAVTNSADYAKTVTTGGGRFECRDINGEVVWRSAEIDISEYKNITIQLTASETGSGKNEENKYLKAFYILDDNGEIPFVTNGENLGNWGSNQVEQNELKGQKLQVVVYINNHYSADKVILDEVVVLGEEENPVIIEPRDILISEVLFNPVDDGSDYVEIYNNSQKQIPLNKLYLASRDKNLELTQIYPLSTKKIVFKPGDYLALTKDTNGVFPFFKIECADCFLQMKKFPSYNNDKDYVVVLDNNLQVIDELFYTNKMHAPLLADENGIALERTSFLAETNDFSNWHSASTQSGYGTPGYKNSQAETETENRPVVTFQPESFSPNSDGYNDEYIIKYQLDKPGYYINITIFDAAGRFVVQLARNEILGTAGKYAWNGTDKTGQRQNLGVYVVVVEIFDLHGNIYRYKDGVVLTAVLE
jgi:hypothetical protein